MSRTRAEQRGIPRERSAIDGWLDRPLARTTDHSLAADRGAPLLEQLAICLEHGATWPEALNAVGALQPDATLRERLAAASERLRAGHSLVAVLEDLGLPERATAGLQRGVRIGATADTLRRTADTWRRDEAILTALQSGLGLPLAALSALAYVALAAPLLGLAAAGGGALPALAGAVALAALALATRTDAGARVTATAARRVTHLAGPRRTVRSVRAMLATAQRVEDLASALAAGDPLPDLDSLDDALVRLVRGPVRAQLPQLLQSHADQLRTGAQASAARAGRAVRTAAWLAVGAGTLALCLLAMAASGTNVLR